MHWVWYSVFFTAALARLFESNRISPKYDFVLVLPVVSGIADWFENHFQHFFLSTPDFATVVDPLPLISTMASNLKWLLAACYVTIAVVLCIRALIVRRTSVQSPVA